MKYSLRHISRVDSQSISCRVTKTLRFLSSNNCGPRLCLYALRRSCSNAIRINSRDRIEASWFSPFIIYFGSCIIGTFFLLLQTLKFNKKSRTNEYKQCFVGLVLCKRWTQMDLGLCIITISKNKFGNFTCLDHLTNTPCYIHEKYFKLLFWTILLFDESYLGLSYAWNILQILAWNCTANLAYCWLLRNVSSQHIVTDSNLIYLNAGCIYYYYDYYLLQEPLTCYEVFRSIKIFSHYIMK